VRGHEGEQKTQETNQIPVIDPEGFVEQERVSVAEAKKQGANAVKKAGGDEEGEHSQDGPVNIESVARPRLDPGKSVIFKQEPRLEPEACDPIIKKVKAGLPNHHQAERDPEENEGRNINRPKGGGLQFRKEIFDGWHRQTAMDIYKFSEVNPTISFGSSQSDCGLPRVARARNYD
jgi:hypothetical protein